MKEKGPPRRPLGGRPFHGRILLYRSLSSTQAKASLLASRGAEEGTVVVAASQRRGRGRHGRRWSSPKGGLWFSVILRPASTGFSLGLLGLAGGLALASALEALCGLEVRLKWPNDVVLRERKIAGVLSEAVFVGSALQHMVLGIGVNTNFPRNRLPAELRQTATTVRAELGRDISNEQLLDRILQRLGKHYRELGSGRTTALLKAVRQRTQTIGRQVELTLSDGVATGVAIDMNSEGALVVQLADGSRRFFPHDVLSLVEMPSSFVAPLR